MLELMVVLAVIGVLAAIAIPQYRIATLKAQRAELPTNVDGIRNAIVAYLSAYDEHADGPWHPDNSLVTYPRPWHPAPPEWQALGWAPDGDVRGIYHMNAWGSANPSVQSLSDLDGDGNDFLYGLNALDSDYIEWEVLSCCTGCTGPPTCY